MKKIALTLGATMAAAFALAPSAEAAHFIRGHRTAVVVTVAPVPGSVVVVGRPLYRPRPFLRIHRFQPRRRFLRHRPVRRRFGFHRPFVVRKRHHGRAVEEAVRRFRRNRRILHHRVPVRTWRTHPGRW